MKYRPYDGIKELENILDNLTSLSATKKNFDRWTPKKENKEKMDRVFNDIKISRMCASKLGDNFSEHMYPYMIKKGVIYFNVDSPIWSQQYSMMKNEIIGKLNSEPRIFKIVINDVRFKVGSFKKSDYILSEVEAENFKKTVEKVELSEQEKEFVNEITDKVHPELKDNFHLMTEKILKFQKYKRSE